MSKFHISESACDFLERHELILDFPVQSLLKGIKIEINSSDRHPRPYNCHDILQGKYAVKLPNVLTNSNLEILTAIKNNLNDSNNKIYINRRYKPKDSYTLGLGGIIDKVPIYVVTSYDIGYSICDLDKNKDEHQHHSEQIKSIIEPTFPQPLFSKEILYSGEDKEKNRYEKMIFVPHDICDCEWQDIERENEVPEPTINEPLGVYVHEGIIYLFIDRIFEASFSFEDYRGEIQYPSWYDSNAAYPAYMPELMELKYYFYLLFQKVLYHELIHGYFAIHWSESLKSFYSVSKPNISNNLSEETLDNFLVLLAYFYGEQPCAFRWILSFVSQEPSEYAQAKRLFLSYEEKSIVLKEIRALMRCYS